MNFVRTKKHSMFWATDKNSWSRIVKIL